MSTYIRGPTCGVNNCPSKLWRIIDGRRTCQFGHVMEGDVEFNDEDEDTANAGIVTRRLNLTTSATGNFQSNINSSQSHKAHFQEGGKKVFGPEAKTLFIRSLQLILKKQCRWLIETYNLSHEFEKVVKIIWIRLLKSMENSDGDDSGDREKSKPPGNRREPYRLSLISTLGILYLSSVQMGIPIYTCDLIKWAMSGRLPYFKSNEKLPKSWRSRLPNYYLGILEGGKGPERGQIFIHIAQLCSKAKFTEEFGHSVNYQCLLLKLVFSRILPPEFFLFAIQLIKTTSKDKDFELNAEAGPQSWIDLQIAAYFLLTLRWLLLHDANSYRFKWIQTLLKPQRRRDVSLDTIDQNVLKISKAQRPAQKTFEWSDEEIAQYLSWTQDTFLPMQRSDHDFKLDQMIAKRKLHKLFPLQSETFCSGDLYDTQNKISFIHELQERYAFFQEQFSSSSNGHDKEPTNEDRVNAINELENQIAEELTVEFSVSSEQLRVATKNIYEKCVWHLSKKHEHNRLTSDEGF